MLKLILGYHFAMYFPILTDTIVSVCSVSPNDKIITLRQNVECPFDILLQKQ